MDFLLHSASAGTPAQSPCPYPTSRADQPCQPGVVRLPTRRPAPVPLPPKIRSRRRETADRRAWRGGRAARAGVLRSPSRPLPISRRASPSAAADEHGAAAAVEIEFVEI